MNLEKLKYINKISLIFYEKCVKQKTSKNATTYKKGIFQEVVK